MADYRQDKSIIKRYLQIGIVPLLMSLITIGVGVSVIIFDSPARQYYYFELLLAVIIIISGGVGVVGACHRYKELPQGKFCCCPGGLGVYSAGFNFTFWCIGLIFFAPCFTLEKFGLGELLYFGVFQTLIIFISMFGVLCNRTYGIVGGDEKISVLGMRGIKDYSNSDIAYVTDKNSFFNYKAYDHEGKILFRYVMLWDDSEGLFDELRKHNITFERSAKKKSVISGDKKVKLQNELVRSEKLYRVGYMSDVDKYVMACVVPAMAWYDRYYEISKEEYDSFGSEALDKLALEMNTKGVKSDRFLFSDKKEENKSL